jgi:hypothetical protein
VKRSLPILAVCATTVMFVAGCSKTDVPTPPSAPKQASTPAQPPPPPMPAANVPKGAEASAPVPGQAGDDSSEAFKGGGKTDPHK